jgi:2-iminobutanoate/2-iminopropanoate deaminase
MRKQLINPPQRYDGRLHGLSHAVVDTATATVYISGQVDWDMNH